MDIELVCRLGADAAAAHRGGVAMSFYALCASILIADPRRREGAKGVFATATLKLPLAADDDAILVNVIAFGDKATQLPDFVWDDAVAISGRTRPRRWTGRDGSVHHGLLDAVDDSTWFDRHRRFRARRKDGHTVPVRRVKDVIFLRTINGSADAADTDIELAIRWFRGAGHRSKSTKPLAVYSKDMRNDRAMRRMRPANRRR